MQIGAQGLHALNLQLRPACVRCNKERNAGLNACLCNWFRDEESLLHVVVGSMARWSPMWDDQLLMQWTRGGRTKRFFWLNGGMRGLEFWGLAAKKLTKNSLFFGSQRRWQLIRRGWRMILREIRKLLNLIYILTTLIKWLI